MKIILLIIVFLAAQTVYSQEKIKYSSNLLVLTYPPGFCQKLLKQKEQGKQCKGNYLQDIWDKQSLTIHGFWPQSTNRNYQKLLDNKTKQDPDCKKSMDFNVSKFTQKEEQRLYKYWPKYGPMKEDFWNYEWRIHGKCYLTTIKENGSLLSQSSIMRNYFLKTVERAQFLNIKLRRGTTFLDKKSFARAIKLPVDTFDAICSGSKQLLFEIRICYNQKSIPGTEQIIPCPSFSFQSCRFPITLK